MAKRTATVLGLLLASSTLACAGDSMQMGPGIKTCAEFEKDYAEDRLTEIAYFLWALGYMSALNLAAVGTFHQYNNLGATSQEEQKAFLRRWCNEHPREKYREGVFALYQTLPNLPFNEALPKKGQ
jgi:hypothetical protein